MTNDDIGFLHAGVRIMGQEYETTKDYNFNWSPVTGFILPWSLIC